MSQDFLRGALEHLDVDLQWRGDVLWVETARVDAARRVLNATPLVPTREHGPKFAAYGFLHDDQWKRVWVSPSPPPSRSLRLGKGIAIAFVGPDGAGKSTLVNAVTQWLSLFELRDIYLGHGDVVTETWQQLASLKNTVLQRKTTTSNSVRPKVEQQATGEKTAQVTGVRAVLKDAAAVARASRKSQRLAELDDARTSGTVVIADRFPDPEVYFADGAELAETGGASNFSNAFAALEQRAFTRFSAIQPDIVFKLCVDAEVAWERKKENTLEQLQTKIDAVDRASYPGAKVVRVDANQSFELVLNRVQSELANVIVTRPRKVEFVGLPAVGKSTLVDAVVERVGTEKVRTRGERQNALGAFHGSRSRVDRWTLFGSFAANHAGFFSDALQLVANSDPTSNDVWRRLRFLIREAENTAIFERRHRDPKLEVHDQHLIQEIWSTTFLNDVSPDIFPELLSALRPWLPDLIVHVDCDIATLMQRMGSRLDERGPTGDIDAMLANGALTEQVLERSAQTLRRIVDAASDIGIDVMTLDARESVGANADIVCSHFDSLASLD